MEKTIKSIGYDAKRFFRNRSGLGNYSRDLVRLVCDYLPVQEVSLLYGYPPPSSYEEKEKTTVLRPKHWVWQAIPALWRSVGIVNSIKENKINIYHGLSAELPFFKPPNTKYIVTVHDLIFVTHPEWYDSISTSIYKMKLKSACQLADIIICISKHTQKELCEYLPGIAHKTRVVYQTCNVAFQKLENPQKIDINAILDTKNDVSEYGICVGNIEERKNGLNLIKAIEKLPSLNFIFIGSGGKYKEKLIEYVKINQLAHRIFFLEKLAFNTFYALMYHAQWSAYLSHEEGFGIPIIESLFCKIPVITNEVGVFREAAAEGGVYTNVNDIDCIADKIKYLVDNPQECKKIGEQGYKHVEKFRDKNIAKQLQEVYFELL